MNIVSLDVSTNIAKDCLFLSFATADQLKKIISKIKTEPTFFTNVCPTTGRLIDFVKNHPDATLDNLNNVLQELIKEERSMLTRKRCPHPLLCSRSEKSYLIS